MTGRDLDPTLKRLLGSGEPEIGCDECFDQLDRYVELQLAGASADELVPGLRAHLVGNAGRAAVPERQRGIVVRHSALGRVGGGVIGSAIAAGLVGNGVRVTMLFPEPGIGFRLFPLGLSQFVAEYYREKGVDVRTEELVKSASGKRVETESGLTLEADAVVAGLGVIPDTELAESAGLEVAD